MSTHDAKRFAQIDQDNPEVWLLFVRFTQELIGRGFRHHSAYAVMHRVRWETMARLDDDSAYKISNGWIPYYARKYHRLYPHHEGFFICRTAQADNP